MNAEMTLENKIKKIAEVSGLKGAEVKKLIEKKKEDAAGLLTDHGAIYALEKEYGISPDESEAKADYTRISDLKSNSNNVNVVGAVKEIRPVKKFQTEKRSGQFARIILADGSGEVSVVFWDKTAEVVQSDKIKLGMLVAIRNGYTKESLDKKPEIHVGNLSRVIIDPKNIDKKDLKAMPKIDVRIKKIGELKEGDVTTTQGRVLYLYPKSEFQRKDGGTGYRSSMIIEDETGKLRIVLWDANADLIEGFNEGSVVKVENGQVRTGNRGLEMHAGNRARVLKSDAIIAVPKAEMPKLLKIAEIDPAAQNLNVAGRVTRIFPIKEFSSGERQGKLASMIIGDDTGMIRAVLWNEKADQIKDIAQGDTVMIKNAYAKQNMNGESEVHVSSRGILQVNPEDVNIAGVSELITKHAEEKMISDLEPDDKNVRVNVKIEDIDENPMVFEICSECGARIENVAGEWLCDICGEAKPAYGMVVSCGVADKSGDIRAVFYRDVAEELTGMNVPDALNLIGQAGDETAPIREIRSELAGKRLALTGNVRYNDYQDKLELIVSAIAPLTAAAAAESPSNAPKKSASKKKEAIPEDVPKEVLDDADIDVEEITLDD